MSYLETELLISGVPVQMGLVEGGARTYMANLVNSTLNVSVDGHVMRLPKYDLKVILRATILDTDIILAVIRNAMEDIGKDNINISMLRSNHYCTGLWPTKPAFKVLRSASREAKKSPLSDDVYDNKSVRSGKSMDSD
jgi:hypothetical protein